MGSGLIPKTPNGDVLFKQKVIENQILFNRVTRKYKLNNFLNFIEINFNFIMKNRYRRVSVNLIFGELKLKHSMLINKIIKIFHNLARPIIGRFQIFYIFLNIKSQRNSKKKLKYQPYFKVLKTNKFTIIKNNKITLAN